MKYVLRSPFFQRYLTSFSWAYNNANLPPNKVYFFNTYFYSSLSKPQKGQRGINYNAVQRWTAKEDIFNYDYVVVPINEE